MDAFPDFWCLKSLVVLFDVPSLPCDKENLEVDGSTTQNILKPPASPCFTHLLRLYQGVSLLWSHPWTQPQIWQRWSTLAIFGIGAVQGDFSWFDGVQWRSFFQKNQRIQHGTNQDLSEIQNDDFKAFILATVDVWVCVKTHNHVQSVFHMGTTNSWPKNWIVQEQSQEDWFFVEHPWTSDRWHKKRNNQWTLYPICGAWNLWLCCLTS